MKPLIQREANGQRGGTFRIQLLFVHARLPIADIQLAAFAFRGRRTLME
ncbi:hypothetical protein [Nocardia abscessus]|nr:hypothetical protein [Nocardia abscessus]